jgi:hypothetical protein
MRTTQIVARSHRARSSAATTSAPHDTDAAAVATRPRSRALAIGLAFLLAAITVVTAELLVPAGAIAATTAPNYRIDPVRYSTGTEMGSCRGWGGDSDAAGNFYMACPVMRDLDGNGTGDVQAPALFELTPTGTVARIGWLPAEYAFDNRYDVRDVAVTPDGRTAYVSTGPVTDNLGTNPNRHPDTGAPLAGGATAGSILRLTRHADGSWQHDPTFKAGPFLLGGNYWAIRSVDVDARGRIYVTVNAYVYELDPATGAIVSSFGGGQTAYPGGPWVEGIDVGKGLVVSEDGSTILVVEQQHHMVQRWRRTGATTWARDTSLLIGVPSQEGDELCTSNAHLQSPYDVGVDAAGDIYVLDTTCQRIQRFTSTGTFVQTVWTNVGGDDLNHGMAVNWQGSILLPIEEDLLVRLDPPARPPATGGGPRPGCTDQAPPRITKVTAPRRSTTRRVAITVAADDDCGITHVRALGHRSGAARWVAGSSVRVQLSGWNGRRQLLVQVRDGAGRVASRRISVILALPQPPLRARRVVQLRGSSCSTLPVPQRATGYRVVDRCARIGGRVLQSHRRAGSVALQVLVPVHQARAMYVNAVGPVQVWVVADRQTVVRGRIVVGRPVQVDGALVADRAGRSVHAMAVDRITAR